MFHRWAALLLVLALCAMSPKTAAGQSQSKPRGQGASGLGSYPNPFNPEAFFPFDVRVDECTDGSRQHVVTLKIYNVLMQPIATPTLRASSTSTTPVSSPKREPSLGMTTAEVLLTSWGNPIDKRSSGSPNGRTEVWVYSGNRALYFYNGILTNIKQ